MDKANLFFYKFLLISIVLYVVAIPLTLILILLDTFPILTGLIMQSVMIFLLFELLAIVIYPDIENVSNRLKGNIGKLLKKELTLIDFLKTK